MVNADGKDGADQVMPDHRLRQIFPIVGRFESGHIF
jgi:hypothetical protein